MYSHEDLPVVLVRHPEGSRGSRREFLFIVGRDINQIIIHGKKVLQIFSFLSNLYSVNAEGSSGAANPPSHALNVRFVYHPFMSISFLFCCLVHISINYGCDKTVFLIKQMLLPIVAEHYSLFYVTLCYMICL